MKNSYSTYLLSILLVTTLVFLLLYTSQRKQLEETQNQLLLTQPILNFLSFSLKEGNVDSSEYKNLTDLYNDSLLSPIATLNSYFKKLEKYQNNNQGILNEIAELEAQVIVLTLENSSLNAQLTKNNKTQRMELDSLLVEISLLQKLNTKAQAMQSQSLSALDSLQRQNKILQTNQKSILRFKSVSGVDITYFGSSQNGLAYGEGIGFYSNGNEYDGAWQGGKKHGYGVYKFPNGERYEGNFHTDKRQGFGKYYWPNGEIYIGYWYNDRRHGEGYITDKFKTKTSSGIWKNDLLDRQAPIEFKEL
jgi:hypothetical protein